MPPQLMSYWCCFFPLYNVLHQQSNLFPWSVLISRFHSARCYGCQSLHENQQNLNHGAYPPFKTRLAEFPLIFWARAGESGKEVKFLSAYLLFVIYSKKQNGTKQKTVWWTVFLIPHYLLDTSSSFFASEKKHWSLLTFTCMTILILDDTIIWGDIEQHFKKWIERKK